MGRDGCGVGLDRAEAQHATQLPFASPLPAWECHPTPKPEVHTPTPASRQSNPTAFHTTALTTVPHASPLPPAPPQPTRACCVMALTSQMQICASSDPDSRNPAFCWFHDSPYPSTLCPVSRMSGLQRPSAARRAGGGGGRVLARMRMWALVWMCMGGGPVALNPSVAAAVGGLDRLAQVRGCHEDVEPLQPSARPALLLPSPCPTSLN